MTNTQVVILGMPRSGTSLVAHVCRLLGVFMGEHFNPNAQGNPGGSLEDEEARQITHSITAGRHETLLHERLTPEQDRAMRQFVARRNEQYTLWGWKDCHTGWIAWQWNERLSDPRYIWVRREMEAVLSSWARLWAYHPLLALIRMCAWDLAHRLFLAGRPHLEVWYEELAQTKNIERIARFIGVEPNEAAREWIIGGK